MLLFGTDNYPPNRWGNDTEEKEWRLLLHESMRDLNERAFIADCKRGDNAPDRPPHDYFLFDPDDWISVFWRASAVCKCLEDIRTKAWRARRALPPIEALPQAIRGCSRRLLMEYLEDWARGLA
jgi:hypothetical protein